MQMGRSQNALLLLHLKGNAPCYGNSRKKMLFIFISNNAFIHSYFFLTPYKNAGLLSAVTVSLHYLPQMTVFNSHMRKSPYCLS